MSPRAPLLVISLVVVLVLSTAGCIEVKEKPPEGPFTIELVSQAMYFVPETGGQLEGPHATVDTEIPHAHEGYGWDIEGLGEFDGAAVVLPAHDVGVSEAFYNVHFIDQENHTGVSIATVPGALGDYLVFADGTPLEEDGDGSDSAEFDLEWGDDLDPVSDDEGGVIREYTGPSGGPMALSIELDSGAEEAAIYILGFHVGSGDQKVEDVASIRIEPGEVHNVSYLDAALNVNITTDGDPVFDGTYGDLPSAYRTHIGHLDWEGHVGEEEESPGFGAVLSMTAVATVALLLVGSRRR